MCLMNYRAKKQCCTKNRKTQRGSPSAAPEYCKVKHDKSWDLLGNAMHSFGLHSSSGSTMQNRRDPHQRERKWLPFELEVGRKSKRAWKEESL